MLQWEGGNSEETLYAAVYSYQTYIVGAKNPTTGVFALQIHDTIWRHLGADNLKAFGIAAQKKFSTENIYIAAGNGLHLSTDHGAHWRITTDWRVTDVHSVCVAQDNPQHEYIGTAYGIFKSTDGCRTWKKANHGLTSRFISSLIIDHDDSNILYCATEEGTYVSWSRGERWSKINVPIEDVRVISQHFIDKRILAVGTGNDGVYLSTDRGKTWFRSTIGMEHKTIYSIAFDPTDADVIYTGGYETGIYKSTDRGKTWNRFTRGFVNHSVHSIIVDPNNHERIFVGTLGDGVYRSDDAGFTWEHIGLRGAQVWSMFLQP